MLTEKERQDWKYRAGYGRYPMETVDIYYERIQRLLEAYDAQEEELKHVLSDWNDLVKAIGAPKNGIAIGHAKALVAERDKYKSRAEAMERAMNMYTYCAYCVHQPDPECRGCRGRLPGLNVKTFVFDESRFTAQETAENEQQTDLINKNE